MYCLLTIKDVSSIEDIYPAHFLQNQELDKFSKSAILTQNMTIKIMCGKFNGNDDNSWAVIQEFLGQFAWLSNLA